MYKPSSDDIFQLIPHISLGQTVMQNILSLVCSCIFLYAFQKALAFWKAAQAIQYAQVPFTIIAVCRNIGETGN